MSQLQHAMAERNMRQAHLLWHAAREHWARMPERERQRFRDRHPEWEPSSPSLDANRKVRFDNQAGLDFLAMHRQMVQHARHVAEACGEQLIEWATLPSSDDPRFPPPPLSVGRTTEEVEAKNDEVWKCWAGAMEDIASRCALARNGCISTLGTILEYGIHAVMHLRFGGDATNAARRLPGILLRVPEDPEYDDPAYDTLLDTYSAHVHPWFWGIHTWIDAQIGKWEDVRGEQADLSRGWAGGWHPKMPTDHSMHHEHGHDDHRYRGALAYDHERRPDIPPTNLGDAINMLNAPGDCGTYAPRLTLNEILDHLN